MSNTAKNQPLNVHPIGPNPPAYNSTLPDGQTGIHGICPTWCEAAEGNQSVSVEEHGLWCESTSRGARGLAKDGERSEVHALLTSPYRHGVYEDAEVNWRAYQVAEVGLVTVDAQEQQTVTFFSSAEARKLAAALLWVADAADMIDAPLERPQRRTP